MVLTSASGDGSMCIFGDTYGFQVIPGASDKVLFYFQGGGACWDMVTTNAGLCTTTIAPNGPTGVFDRTNNENPFKDFTIVHALYCSGDVWAGRKTAKYTHYGAPVTQQGHQNAKVTMNWLSRQQKLGHIAKDLDSFVTSGCSAGSVGVQLWADVLLSAYPAKHMAVIPDSYAGVFPAGSIGPLMVSFGVCSTSLIPLSLKEDCLLGKLEIHDVARVHISKFPDVPFAYIQSKIDAVQQSFYVAMGLTTRNASAAITPANFYADVSEVFASYNALDNFITFLVDGPMHCFTPFSILYDTTAAGPYGDRQPLKEPLSLVSWLQQFPLHKRQRVETKCLGPVRPAERDDLSTLSYKEYGEKLYQYIRNAVSYMDSADGGAELTHEHDQTKYCADSIVPKTFRQKLFS